MRNTVDVSQRGVKLGSAWSLPPCPITVGVALANPTGRPGARSTGSRHGGSRHRLVVADSCSRTAVQGFLRRQDARVVGHRRAPWYKPKAAAAAKKGTMSQGNRGQDRGGVGGDLGAGDATWTLDEQRVNEVARFARVALGPSERAAMLSSLGGILEAMAALSRLDDVEDADVAATVANGPGRDGGMSASRSGRSLGSDDGPTAGTLRDDVPRATSDEEQSEFLRRVRAAAPEIVDDCFAVPLALATANSTPRDRIAGGGAPTNDPRVVGVGRLGSSVGQGAASGDMRPAASAAIQTRPDADAPERPPGPAAWSAAVARGDVNAVAHVERVLSRIAKLDGGLGCFLHVDAEAAVERAAAIDRGEVGGPFAGMPVAVKDNLCTAAMPTTCGSAILQGYRPPYDAEVVSRLLDAGAVIVGKTNMDEFGMGSSNESSAFFPVRNPWDHDRVPGGSSGGSAAAVAAGLASAALGSDTGGSVRLPAAFCGLAALKPTYGRISRYGLVAFASSLDQVGPMARTVTDVACLTAVLAGRDERDATSSSRPVDGYLSACSADPRGMRVAIWRGASSPGGEASADGEVLAAMNRAIVALEAAGVVTREVALPHADLALAAYYLIAPAEASSNLARFDGMRFGERVVGSTLEETYERSRGTGLGSEVKRRILLGTFALSAGYHHGLYLRAQQVRRRIASDFAAAFLDADVVLMPTAPEGPFPLGTRSEDPLAMYRADVCTVPASLAGLPALSVPVGVDAGGLPIGLQLVGPAFAEAALFTVGATLERVLCPQGLVPPAYL